MHRALVLSLIFLMSCSFRETNLERKEKEIPEMRRALFLESLVEALESRGLDFRSFCNLDEELEGRILREYGALFLASSRVKIPSRCVFSNEGEVTTFQDSTSVMIQEIAGTKVELQTEAMKAYLDAREEALKQGLDITPRGGEEASRRSFADTLRLWNSRFEPACEYWKQKGRLTEEQINFLKALPIKDQVKEVLRLEREGIFFNTRFDGTILRSVAAPGASQHLSMLALDINEYKNEKVRQIMNQHGWFRTVVEDEPHFTFLGRSESELRLLGLKRVEPDFWIPDLPY